MQLTKNLSKTGKNLVFGLSIVELLSVLSITGALSLIGFQTLSKYSANVREVKLETDVETINSAINVYLANGGWFFEESNSEGILAKLKTVAVASQRESIAGLRGSMIDHRLIALPLPREEESGSKPRAVWNNDAQTFEIKNLGPGIEKFVLGEIPEVMNEEQRRFSLMYSTEDHWVWNYKDYYSTEMVGPQTVDLTLVNESPLNGIPGTTPNSPGSPGFPAGAGENGLSPLAAPLFDGGLFPLRNFPLTVRITNPNAADSATIVHTDGETWRISSGFETVLPSTTIVAYVQSNDGTYLDSETTEGTVTAIAAEITAQFIPPVFSVKYADMVGLYLPGDMPPPEGEAPGLGAIVVDGLEAVPPYYTSSEFFNVTWTTDRTNPVESQTAATGSPFAGHYVANPVPITLASFPDKEGMVVNAAVLSQDQSLILNSPVSQRGISIEPEILRKPLLTTFLNETGPVDDPGDPGLDGGHFDLDTSSFIADINNGTTDGHVHEYDDNYDVMGADFFHLEGDKLHPITEDIPDVDTKFKLIIANADLSISGRLAINSTYDLQNSGTYTSVTEYDDISVGNLPVYSLAGGNGAQKLESLGLYFPPNAIKSGGLLPTNTGDVKGNKPGKNGEWRNGALTIQAIAINGDGTLAGGTDTSLSAGGVQGVATSGLLWEATIFWHWDGDSYHMDTNQFIPGVPPDLSSDSEALLPPDRDAYESFWTWLGVLVEWAETQVDAPQREDYASLWTWLPSLLSWYWHLDQAYEEEAVPLNAYITTISLDTQYGDMPVGAQLYYTLDGTDPGDDGSGGPLSGSIYTEPFSVEEGTPILARVYPPEALQHWFEVSDPIYIRPEHAEPTPPTSPNDPADPGEPTDPADPSDPSDPSDPGSEPDDSGDPSDPEDPEHPEDPGDPTDPGLDGGHFDLDTSSSIAEVNQGTTDGHVHEYDDKYDVMGADFFDLADGALHNISEDIADGSTKFKIIIANADLSPEGRLAINSSYDGTSSGTYLKVTQYDDQSIGGLPIYSLSGAEGTVKLEELGIYFPENAILSGGLVPTKTGEVRANKPGKNGEWRNGALTIQAIAVNDEGTPAYTTDNSLSAGGVQGVATSGLLWEATIFWHWSGESYDKEGNTFVPGETPDHIE